MIPIYTLLLIIALAVGLAFLNNKYWEKIDTWWHIIQWLCVAAFAIGYVAFTKEYFSALFVWSAVHWVVFEAVLYRLRGLTFRYVGTTAFTDRVIRWIARGFVRLFGGTETAQAGTVVMWLKSWAVLGSLIVYHLECGC